MNRAFSIGRMGEEEAVKYITDNGFNVISRNFRIPGGEIDIVAKDKEMLVFIEVKNYSYRNFYKPEYAIGERKKYRLRRAAEEYLYRNDFVDNDCRFDVVLIFRDWKGSKKVELIKNAFM